MLEPLGHIALPSVDTSTVFDTLRGMASPVTRSVEQAQRLFHALSDDTRLKILERLREGEQCVCDLTDDLGAAQSRLSFHLKTLKDADLVTDRREGRWVYYTLNPDTLAALGELVSELRPKRAPAGRRGP